MIYILDQLTKDAVYAGRLIVKRSGRSSKENRAQRFQIFTCKLMPSERKAIDRPHINQGSEPLKCLDAFTRSRE